MLLDLDATSVSGFAGIPALDDVRIDLKRITDAAPIDALRYLIAVRFVAIGSQFDNFHKQNDGSKPMGPLVVRMYSPVNPLLLTTAISVCIVRGNDVHSFLSNYALGLEVPGLEEHLIQIDVINDNEELRRVLELEDSFYGALLELGTSILVRYGRLIRDRGIPTMLDLYWGCWLAMNPGVHDNEVPAESSKSGDSFWMNGWRRGIKWGIDYNSMIHNAREHYEYKLNEVNGSINAALANSAPSVDKRAKLQELTTEQQTLTLLVERARRLYYWAPHEISAYSAQTAYALEMIERLRSDPKSQEIVEHMLAEHEKFLLPRHIIKQMLSDE